MLLTYFQGIKFVMTHSEQGIHTPLTGFYLPNQKLDFTDNLAKDINTRHDAM